MTITPIPLTGSIVSSRHLFGECYNTVNQLKEFHFCDDDLPPLLVEAAAFWDVGFRLAGLRTMLESRIDLADLYRKSWLFLDRLELAPDAVRLRDDLKTSAEELTHLTPEETFN